MMERKTISLPGVLLWSVVALSASASTVRQQRPEFYVKKDTWQETMRCSLIEIEQLTRRQQDRQRQMLEDMRVEPGPWYTIGPFTSPNRSPYEVVFGPEEGVDLSRTYDNGRLKWTRRDDWVDGEIHKLSGDGASGEGLIAADYVYRQIKTGAATELTLYLGSNDGIQVWFNGEKVLARDIGRKAGPDQDVVKVRCRKGVNELLIKVNNRAANHAYYFSLQSGGGQRHIYAERLWALVMQDFAGAGERQQMGWEKQDGIWVVPAQPGNLEAAIAYWKPAAVAKRYAGATRQIGKLPARAERLAANVTDLKGLERVRRVYYRSRRYERQIADVRLKLRMVTNQYEYLKQRFESGAGQADRQNYRRRLDSLSASAKQYLEAAAAGKAGAVRKLAEIEKQLDELYRSGLPKAPPREKIPACRPFDLRLVRLLDGPFRDAMLRDRKYLYMLDSQRLLHMFRVTAGLPSSAEPLGGWEKRQLRGHTMGHYLSACALMYAATGDVVLKAKADAIVAELAKCQKALGTGYLGAFPEEGFKKVIYGIGPWWAPWYTYHKIMAGLLDMYHHCGNKQALDIAVAMAGWAKMNLDSIDEQQTQRMLEVEFGGMNEVLSNLYAVTKDPDHLALARRFDHKAVFEPLANFQDRLTGLHVNTQIPKIIGAAREYELTRQPYYYNIATFFWQQVVSARSYCTGGTSNHEHWRTGPYELAGELSCATQETCCTYNMLKLTRHLFCWSADARCGDFYERALFNGILSTQDPNTGMMMYFVPLASGYWKIFNTPYDSFWCCTGTGMENHARYGESIYFYDDKGIYVNLFIASELSWPEKGVVIRQETGFPEQQGTSLIVKTQTPKRFAIRIRMPYWLASPATITINNQKQQVKARPVSFVTLERVWADGDRIDVSLPMKLHLAPMPDDANLAAIMYGPLVLAGELGTEGMDKRTVYSASQGVLRSVRVRPAPYFVADKNDLDSWVKPVAGKALTFRTVNAGRPKDVTLIPFYKLFGQRYAIYWRFKKQ